MTDEQFIVLEDVRHMLKEVKRHFRIGDQEELGFSKEDDEAETEEE